MKRKAFLFWFLLLFSFQPLLTKTVNTYSIDPVRTIGDDIHDEYFFMNITTGIISGDHEIFVGDSGGKFIARYTWDGTFVKRVGKAGQGPGDFLSIRNFNFVKSNLITYDAFNRRIVVLNRDLDILEYIKVPSPVLSGNIIPVGENRLLCSFRGLRATKGAGRIGYLDSEGKLGHCFFRRDQFGNTSMTRDDLKWALDMMVNKLLIGYDEGSDTLLAGFEYPAVPAEFFLLNSRGEERGRFILKTQKGMVFPEFKRRFPRKTPSSPIKYLVVRSILNHHGDFLVLTSVQQTGEKNSEEISSTCHVISAEGIRIARIALTPGSRFFAISKDGYIIGRNFLDEIPRVHIWRLARKGEQDGE